MIVDWLIVGCLTSSSKYFMNIHDDNQFNTIYKLYRNNSGNAFWLLHEKYGKLGRNNNFSKSGLWRAREHVTWPYSSNTHPMWSKIRSNLS